MNGLDWTDYTFQPAPPFLLCQFRRKEWAEVHVGYAKDFRPEFNVAELEWKLTGDRMGAIGSDACDGSHTSNASSELD